MISNSSDGLRGLTEAQACEIAGTSQQRRQPSLTIGIEEEYQIIDPETRELRSYITQFLEQGKLQLREQVKAELHQSMVEVGTEICRTPAEARVELIRLRRHVIDLAAANGLVIAAAGTHPWGEAACRFVRLRGVAAGDSRLVSAGNFSPIVNTVGPDRR